MESKIKIFPNGFKCWQETHYEMVQHITQEWLKDNPRGKVKEYHDAQGHPGLYILAEELTDEFEKKNEGRQWDGEFYEEVSDFALEKLGLTDGTGKEENKS